MMENPAHGARSSYCTRRSATHVSGAARSTALRPDFEVVAPDLPGWGPRRSRPSRSRSSTFVAAELPAVLVGNSFGGAVALRTALAHQDQVERLVLVGAGLPAWDWTEEMRDYFAAEEDAIEAGDLDAATEINLEFWVAPAHRDEVRPQQRRALELQTAHEEPEVLWPEMAPLSTLRDPDARRRRRRRQGGLPRDRPAPRGGDPRRRPRDRARAPVTSSASISPRS